MWIRRIEVTVKNSKTQAILLDTHQNRIDFSYQGNLSWIGDKLKLDIYNLGVHEVRSLIDSGEDGRDILVRVGYEDDIENMAILMDGIVVNANGMKQLPHHITSLWCVPKWGRNLDDVHPLRGYNTGLGALKTVLTDLATLGGFTAAPTFVGMSDEILNDLVINMTFNGDVRAAFAQLGDMFRFYTRNSGAGVAVISKLNSVATLGAIKGSPLSKSHTLKANRVRGTPQAQPAVITVPYNLDANIKCGDLIDVGEFISVAHVNGDGVPVQNQVGGPSVSGIIQVNDPEGLLYRTETLWQHTIMDKYLVNGVNHFGSNFTQAWQTNILGVVFNGNRKGPAVSGGDTWHDDVQGRVQGSMIPEVSVSLQAPFTPSTHNLTGGANQGIFNTQFQEGNGLTRNEAQKLNRVQISPAQRTSILKASGGNYQKAQALANKLRIENRGNAAPSNAVSSAGASGPWQMMPATAKALGVDDRSNFDQGAQGAAKLYDEAMKRWDGNRAMEYASYNAGPKRAEQMRDNKPIPKETQDYVRMGMAMEAQQNGGQ